jgi:short-subunit dehydrogenase
MKMKPNLVITGGSKGIGKSIIEKFAAAGYNIFTTSRNEVDLKTLKDSISVLFPTIIFEYIASDLSKKTEVEKFVRFVNSKTDKIDVLVNNAGVYLPGKIIQEPEGQFEKMVASNLYSAYYVSRGIIPLMIANKKGHVFNICSTASIIPYVNGGSYCISKFALYGMSKVLREELKEFDIKVTSVLPGATKTSSWDGVDLPEERFMKAEDVAEIIFMSSQLSKSAVVEEILMRPMDGDIA